MNFGNIATAMITPFDKKGNIDFQKLSILIDYLLKNGSDSLVVAGQQANRQLYRLKKKSLFFSNR